MFRQAFGRIKAWVCAIFHRGGRKAAIEARPRPSGISYRRAAARQWHLRRRYGRRVSKHARACTRPRGWKRRHRAAVKLARKHDKQRRMGLR